MSASNLGVSFIIVTSGSLNRITLLLVFSKVSTVLKLPSASIWIKRSSTPRGESMETRSSLRGQHSSSKLHASISLKAIVELVVQSHVTKKNQGPTKKVGILSCETHHMKMNIQFWGEVVVRRSTGRANLARWIIAKRVSDGPVNDVHRPNGQYTIVKGDQQWCNSISAGFSSK